ncbi:MULTISPECIES: sialidase family protein [unclassified Paenibacillus]|uniref:sialidase family protein n=1 Tax=unclassified Paenibacillus TaxID=185978 RepID=UPI0030F8E6DC
MNYRFNDNGQFVQLTNGDILLAMRSVRWQESYKLRVYKSTNGGGNWSFLSTIDENNGAPGSLSVQAQQCSL